MGQDSTNHIIIEKKVSNKDDEYGQWEGLAVD